MVSTRANEVTSHAALRISLVSFSTFPPSPFFSTWCLITLLHSYASALPAIALLGLGQQRLPAMIPVVVVLIVMSFGIAPFHHTWARGKLADRLEAKL